MRKKWIAVLAFWPSLVIASDAPESVEGAQADVVSRVSAMTAFKAAENCRNRSLLIGTVAEARESGMPLSQLMSIAGDDNSLGQIIRDAYESDQDVSEQENAFYESCIDNAKTQMLNRMN